MDNIFREQTQEEKSDFTQLEMNPKDDSVADKFRNQIIKYEKDFMHKNKKPFCSRCARIDFKKKIDEAMFELENRGEFATNLNDIKVKFPDFKEYGKAERFELIKEQDAMEPMPHSTPGTIQRQIKIGIHRDYRCKTRGCGISIFLSNEDLKPKE